MQVFRGICKMGSLERKVAFKFTNATLAENTGVLKASQVLKDVLQEVRIMGQLKDHPHVVQLLGAAFNELNPVLILELADDDLEKYLDENSVDWPTKQRFAFEIALALEAVHTVGVLYVSFCLLGRVPRFEDALGVIRLITIFSTYASL